MDMDQRFKWIMDYKQLRILDAELKEEEDVADAESEVV